MVVSACGGVEDPVEGEGGWRVAQHFTANPGLFKSKQERGWNEFFFGR